MPIIAIIIDQKTPDLEPVCKSFPFKTKTTEFRTFTRENASNVHIHAFESLADKPPMPKMLLNILTVFELVYKKGKTYDESLTFAAKKLHLAKSSRRAMYTREIGLTSLQLRTMINRGERIKPLLVKEFPEYAEAIEAALP